MDDGELGFTRIFVVVCGWVGFERDEAEETWFCQRQRLAVNDNVKDVG